MPVQESMTDDGLIVRRDTDVRIVSWDRDNWHAEHLTDGRWQGFPKSVDADRSGGELFYQGLKVLRALRPR